MGTGETHFELPPKIEEYLAVLSRLYARTKNARLQEIIVNGAPTIHEEWTYDNWNGGTYGHALTLTIPEELFLDVIEDKGDFQDQICKDINSMNNVPNEHIAGIFIEMEPLESDDWRKKSGLLRPQTAYVSVPPKSLARLWDVGQVRVFLSHKAEYKKGTSQLKDCLKRYGIACFVAHEDIEPTEEWQTEIEHALHSMDAMVALLTPDFHESKWTDQEIGFALGRGLPVVAVCLGQDPYGFIGKLQGLQGCDWQQVEDMAAEAYALLYKRLPDKSRLFEAALAAYAGSDSWADSAWKVENVLSTFETLTRRQVEDVVRAYRDNPQNLSSFDGMDALKPLLERWTGERWEVRKNQLKRVKDAEVHTDGLPF